MSAEKHSLMNDFGLWQDCSTREGREIRRAAYIHTPPKLVVLPRVLLTLL